MVPSVSKLIYSELKAHKREVQGLSSLTALPKRAITIWQGWRKQLWISSSAGCDRQRRVPLLRFSTKLKWSYKLLDVVFTGLKRLFQLPRPHLRCENEEGKKQSAGQNMHVCILLLRSSCSSSYSSLARERGFGKHETSNLPFNVWGCFSFGNNHDEFQILSPK